jgi:recombinational DNA repair protein (RecF pathway)
MAQQCEMIIGYLVPHRCENPALGTCSRCGRGYCDEHVQVRQGGLVCLACEQGLEQPVTLPITARTFDAADLATFSALSAMDDEADRSGDLFSDLS